MCGCIGVVLTSAIDDSGRRLWRVGDPKGRNGTWRSRRHSLDSTRHSRNNVRNRGLWGIGLRSYTRGPCWLLTESNCACVHTSLKEEMRSPSLSKTECSEALLYCSSCGKEVSRTARFCYNCGFQLGPSRTSLSSEQLSQVKLEVIWAKEKTVPKLLRGSPQAHMSFHALEKGLSDDEKAWLKHKRDTE